MRAPHHTRLPPTCSYALGLLGWSLLTGLPHPWQGAADNEEIIARSVRGERPDFALVRADAPPALVALVRRACAEEPAARPSAEEMAVALAAIRLPEEEGVRG